MSRTLQYNGRIIDFDNLDEIVFDIDNICNSAVKVCRFNGHTKYHYSNLRHMYMVACVCPHADLKLACLLHDAHEVVIGDIVTPFAESLGPEFKAMIDGVKYRLDCVIARQFNCPELVDPEARKVIKYYDRQMLNVEAQFLLTNHWSLFEPPEIMVDHLDYETNSHVIHNWKSKFKLLMRRKERETIGTQNDETTESGILAACSRV